MIEERDEVTRPVRTVATAPGRGVLSPHSRHFLPPCDPTLTKLGGQHNRIRYLRHCRGHTMTIERISVPLKIEVPTKANFASDDPLPLFLSDRADEHEQQAGSRLPEARILVIAATVSGIAIALALGNPVKFFADAKPSLTQISDQHPGTDQSTPTFQSSADTQALAPTARDAPIRDEIAATFDPADQSQSRIREALSGALLKQFQSWAAKEDARAQVEPVQPVQDAHAQVLHHDRAIDRPIRKHRRVRPVQNAQAEIRPVQKPRAGIRRDQNARVVRPAQDARAQDQSVENAQPPSPSLGWR
jgi:hypothetical protein